MKTKTREKFATQVNSEILACRCAALRKARGGSFKRSSMRRWPIWWKSADKDGRALM